MSLLFAFCPGCGSKFNINDSFCPNCGTTKNSGDAMYSNTFCNGCGSQLVEDSKYCGNCGWRTRGEKKETSNNSTEKERNQLLNNQSLITRIGQIIVILITVILFPHFDLIILWLGIVFIFNSYIVSRHGRSKEERIKGIVNSIIAIVFLLLALLVIELILLILIVNSQGFILIL